MIQLYDHQLKALDKMKNGCILCGGVGSGKSRTALGYYHLKCGGEFRNGVERPRRMDIPLYIITTARKRDSREWDGDMAPFDLVAYDRGGEVIVDSWNNISKYINVHKAFFIFDEQRVVGRGAWVKAFLKITQNNRWILLSATPGDSWVEYAPVFVANGFFKNRTQFYREHVVMNPRTPYPKVDRYLNESYLQWLKDQILVDMDFKRNTVSHDETIMVHYDISRYKDLVKYRFNYEKNEPMKNASELCAALRKVINTNPERAEVVRNLVRNRGRAIVFYSFDYELDILKNIDYGSEFEIAEWNGHVHQPIPDSVWWVYLVQYNAGAEGWNCITTDTVIFYSQQYSYKILTQAKGRVDRLNTPFTDLYYYHIKSRAPLDLMITRAISQKKQFNEARFVAGLNFVKD